METQICLICRKEKELWHILKCEKMKEWREMILEKRIWNLFPTIGIQRLVRGRNTEYCHKIGVYITKFKKKMGAGT
jgi:hypothetical protein